MFQLPRLQDSNYFVINGLRTIIGVQVPFASDASEPENTYRQLGHLRQKLSQNPRDERSEKLLVRESQPHACLGRTALDSNNSIHYF